MFILVSRNILADAFILIPRRQVNAKFNFYFLKAHYCFQFPIHMFYGKYNCFLIITIKFIRFTLYCKQSHYIWNALRKKVFARHIPFLFDKWTQGIRSLKKENIIHKRRSAEGMCPYYRIVWSETFIIYLYSGQQPVSIISH